MTIDVGSNLRRLREERKLSIRALAQMSDLAINTLSLIENGKSSPSVSTLQQLALALNVPITAFFEAETPENNVSYIKAERRPHATFDHGKLEDLGAGTVIQAVEPFVVTLEPNAGSGPQEIIHTGYEFVYCLKGRIAYTIARNTYLLEMGDSLLFEAHLPHCWQNLSHTESQVILVLVPTDERDYPTERHFSQTQIQIDKKGDHLMKVAAITDDGKTISQHFGRAPYYLVVTVEDGEIVDRELREKLGHSQFSHLPHEEEQPGEPHGMGAAAHDKHLRMSEAIADCEALLCGGMGRGAYQSMVARGIKPVVTDIQDIDQAVLAYGEGKIVDRVDKLH